MREKALFWWRNLSQEEHIRLIQKYYPKKDFLLITTSSSSIERIYISELNNIEQKNINIK